MTPTARTLQALRKLGMTADVVERWLPRIMVRKDYLGFADVLALDGQPGVLAIQTTTGANKALVNGTVYKLAYFDRWREF